MSTLPATRPASSRRGLWAAFKDAFFTVNIFRQVIRAVVLGLVAFMLYWAFYASDRYVSEANVVIRKTDSTTSTPSFDLSMLVSGVPGVNRADQLLLREYLLSMDLMKTLDAQLDLRAHYSSTQHDILSRLWFSDAPLEWLYRYYLRRVKVEFDEVAGIIRLRVQAYDPDTAHRMTRIMVEEGERYMNVLGHELANTQVDYLTRQVQLTRQQYQQARHDLLDFQNREELLSPQTTAESISSIIVGLEAQRAQLETRLDSLPKSLARNHPNIVMLEQSLASIDRQIAEERAKLTAATGGRINTSLEQFQQLQMAVDFHQEMYMSAMMALEKGRFDATRMLDKVSVLQAPTLPEYPMEPRRIYNICATLLLGLILIGILKLLEAIVRDHVD